MISTPARPAASPFAASPRDRGPGRRPFPTLLRCGLPAALGLSTVASISAQRPPTGDPFAWFGAAGVVSASDRSRLDRGQILVETLPADGKHVAFLAVIAVDADPAVLLDRLHHLPEFREGPLVPITRMFSNPPRLEDLAEFDLPDRDVDALADCRPGDCKLKLSADEITQLRAEVEGAGANWRSAARQAFRRIVLERMRTYLERGMTGLAPYASSDEPVDLHDRFADVLGQMSPVLDQLPRMSTYLERYPAVQRRDVESVFYWAIEDLRKPVLTVRQVVILDNRSGNGGIPEVLAIDKQIFALHYVDAQISMTAIVRGQGRRNYFVHVNRSEIDLLGGFMAWLRRLLIQNGVEDEAGKLLPVIRTRLERRAAELAASRTTPPQQRLAGAAVRR